MFLSPMDGIGFGAVASAGGAAAVTLEHCDASSSHTGQASSNAITFSNVDLGTQALDRVTVLGITTDNGNGVPITYEIENTAGTLVSCANIIAAAPSGSGGPYPTSYAAGGSPAASTSHTCSLYSLATPSGSFSGTGDIKFTFEGNPYVALVIYALYNASEGHIHKTFHNSSTATFQMDIPAGGAVIGVCGGIGDQAGAWSGDADALTENKDNMSASGNTRLYSASNTYAAQSLSHEIVFTPASAHTEFARTCVAFPPNNRISRALVHTERTGAAATAYTFSSCPLGVGKIIVCGLIYGADADIASITIDGTTATSLAVSTHDTYGRLFLYQVNGNTSATGDIVVTSDSGQSRCGIMVYLVKNAADSASDTLEVSASTNPSGTIDVPEGGMLFSVIGGNNGETPSALTGVDFDGIVGTESVYTVGHPENVAVSASRWYPSASSGGTVSATASQLKSLSAVSFAEAI